MPARTRSSSRVVDQPNAAAKAALPGTDSLCGTLIEFVHSRTSSMGLRRLEVFQLLHSTSLLSLPDNLLLQIFEEVYEQRYGFGKHLGSPQTSGIVINKRLFAIARPRWHSRISITAAQLDQRLAELIDDPYRLERLSQLTLEPNDLHVHIAKLVLTRLRRLTHLSLHFYDDEIDLRALKVLGEGLKEVSTLEHVQLWHWNSSEDKRHSIAMCCLGGIEATENRISIIVENVEIFSCYLDQDEMQLLRLRGDPEGWHDFEWSNIRALKVTRGDDPSISVRSLLDSLEKTLSPSADEDAPLLIPLKRLSIDVSFPSEQARTHEGYFTPVNFTRLLDLLSRTQLERLELTSIEFIPEVGKHVSVPSVKVLKLSGSCNFELTQTFKAFSLLLSSFPSLAQLHLVGSSFFGPGSTADQIANIQPAQLLFDCPQLNSLLIYLGETSVEIFSYRGQDENREVRMTRSSPNEEFDRDCWTIS